MAFKALLKVENGVGKITLTGELDAAVAPVFRDEIEKAAAQNVKKLVLMLSELNYMASAGLRALVFAKQKMGADADIYVIGAQESVTETLELTGFSNSVIAMETYDAAVIEAQ
jgi:anti-sigma B factor antagonist